MNLDLSCTVALPAEWVYQLLSSEDFQAAKADRVNARSFRMAIWQQDSHTVVQTVRTISAARLPDFVKPLVKPTLTVYETEHWHTGAEPHQVPSRADFTVDVSGAPVSFRGELSLQPHGAGSALRYWGELTANVPLFRRQVAEAAIKPVRETILAEFALLEAAAAGSVPAGSAAEETPTTPA